MQANIYLQHIKKQMHALRFSGRQSSPLVLNLTLNITIKVGLNSTQVNWDKNPKLMNETEASIYKPQGDTHTSSGQASRVYFLWVFNVIGS